jgi:hypothetical protein
MLAEETAFLPSLQRWWTLVTGLGLDSVSWARKPLWVKAEGFAEWCLRSPAPESVDLSVMLIRLDSQDSALVFFGIPQKVEIESLELAW